MISGTTERSAPQAAAAHARPSTSPRPPRMLRIPGLARSEAVLRRACAAAGPGFREVPARWHCWPVPLSSGDVWACGSHGLARGLSSRGLWERLEGAERA